MEKVMTWDFTPRDESGKETKWPLERIRAYHLQSIAVSLAQIARDLSWSGEIIERLQQEKWTMKGALFLQQARSLVESWFGASDHMPLSRFVDHMNKHRFYSIHNVQEAIGLTDYLAIASIGRGFQVRLIREGKPNA